MIDLTWYVVSRDMALIIIEPYFLQLQNPSFFCCTHQNLRVAISVSLPSRTFATAKSKFLLFSLCVYLSFHSFWNEGYYASNHKYSRWSLQPYRDIKTFKDMNFFHAIFYQSNINNFRLVLICRSVILICLITEKSFFFLSYNQIAKDRYDF